MKPIRVLLTTTALLLALAVTVLATIPATDNFSGTFTTCWDELTGAGSIVNSGGQAVSQNSGASAVGTWKTSCDTFNADQSSQVDVVTMASGAGFVCIRCSGTMSDFSDFSGYYFGADNAGTPALVNKAFVGSFTQLGASYGTNVNDGDTTKVVVIGSTITPYINGVALATRTDSSVSSGQPGLLPFDAGVTYDNWQGNNEPPAAGRRDGPGLLNGIGQVAMLLFPSLHWHDAPRETSYRRVH